MKNRIVLLVFLISISGFSQKNGTAVYKIYPLSETLRIEKEDDAINKRSKSMLIKAFEIVKTFEYILKFNSNNSISKLDEGMENDVNKGSYLYPVAKALAGLGTHYQDKSQNIKFHQTEIDGKLFIINDSLFSNWMATSEKKQIGTYTCYKAIRNCESCRSSEEVWFTPDIPIPFGPQGYGGLPGLIVEIKKRSSVVRLTKIQFIKDEIPIHKPKKGKNISIMEYQQMVNRIRSNSIGF